MKSAYWCRSRPGRRSANSKLLPRSTGVDGVFIGPSDLAASLGHVGNPQHPDVQKAIKSAVERLTAVGKPAGMLTGNEEEAKRYIDWGYKFVAIGSDVGLLAKHSDALLQAVQELSEQAPSRRNSAICLISSRAVARSALASFFSRRSNSPQDRVLGLPPHADDERKSKAFAIGGVERREAGELLLRLSRSSPRRLLGLRGRRQDRLRANLLPKSGWARISSIWRACARLRDHRDHRAMQRSHLWRMAAASTAASATYKARARTPRPTPSSAKALARTGIECSQRPWRERGHGLRSRTPLKG